MLNADLAARLKGIQDALIAQHTGGRNMPSAARGSEREAFVRDYLQKVFPAHRRFSTGAITDRSGARSGQVDVAVEFPFAPSFPMPGTDDRLLLADSVAAVIEVKSNLSDQWSQLRRTTKAVRALDRDPNSWEMWHTVDWFPDVTGPKIPFIAVGYTGFDTVAKLRRRLSRTPECERPDAAFVVDSGCWYGFGIEAEGPRGLLAMCTAINAIVSLVSVAIPNLVRYVDLPCAPMAAADAS